MAHSNKIDTEYLNKQDMNELNYWSDKFGCTIIQLLQAAEKVGNKLSDIEKHLNTSK